MSTPLDPALRSSLNTLKAGTDEALQMLFVLQQTINNNGVPEMAPWCVRSNNGGQSQKGVK